MKEKGENKMFKEKLKEMIIKSINGWSSDDIYAVSLFVDESDNMTVTLGYNTESQVKESLEETDEEEARWNYAFWLQNEELIFGEGKTEKDVTDWIWKNNLEDEEEITQAFVDVLIQIVKELHEEKVLTKKFGHELPILIHELEYYEEIAIQNKKANGKYLPKEFIDFCYGN